MAACERIAARGGEYAAAAAATVRIAGDHPGDLGVVASLLLRHAVLQPGEAVFMPAGGPHSYLHGTGVELLANSDNVVRAGLTAKHIDVPELLKLTRPGGGRAGHRAAPARRRGVRLRLARAGVPAVPGRARCRRGDPAGRRRRPDRAVHRGRRGAARGSGALKVAKGESCYLSAADGAVTASGPAALFIAGDGIDSCSVTRAGRSLAFAVMKMHVHVQMAFTHLDVQIEFSVN